MEGTRVDGRVEVGGDARQRLHDARGYGRPAGEDRISLSPVEAAYLLARGDLATVDGDGFREFFVANAEDPSGDFAARYLVYADLRERGFYLTTAVDATPTLPPHTDFAVFERGARPPDGPVEHALRVVGERTAVPAADLGAVVLAVVDEESEVTYFETDTPEMDGETAFDPPACSGTLLSERVVVWDPPSELYRHGFYGQPLEGRGSDDPTVLQLSLLEAAALAHRGTLSIAGGASAIVDRGRRVEGDRFDRRLQVYETLRSRGIVPKTGFKFGADFRAYRAVTDVSDLGHSPYLIRVLPADHTFIPRGLALDVRLAGGVRKQLVFALVDDAGAITWLSVGRLTP